LNVLWKDNPRGWVNWALPPCVFTAVVGGLFLKSGRMKRLGIN
jgi:hypothetical protein